MFVKTSRLQYMNSIFHTIQLGAVMKVYFANPRSSSILKSSKPKQWCFCHFREPAPVRYIFHFQRIPEGLKLSRLPQLPQTNSTPCCKTQRAVQFFKLKLKYLSECEFISKLSQTTKSAAREPRWVIHSKKITL